MTEEEKIKEMKDQVFNSLIQSATTEFKLYDTLYNLKQQMRKAARAVEDAAETYNKYSDAYNEALKKNNDRI